MIKQLPLVCTLALGGAALQPPAGQQNYRLVQQEGDEQPTWVPPSTVDSLIRTDHQFMDLTHVAHYEPVQPQPRRERAYPDRLSQQELVSRVTEHFSQADAYDFLERLTSYHTRHYRAPTGRESALWIHSQIESVVADANRTDVDVQLWEHDQWIQPSIVVRVPGSDPNSGTLILGAHIDSINIRDPVNGGAPGANDDGSGTTALFQVMSAVTKGGVYPVRSMEFHYYAAEEGGINGSGEIAAEYNHNDEDVFGMLQLDMVGFDRSGPCATGNLPEQAYRVVINKTPNSYVDEDLTEFLVMAIEEYGDRVIPIFEDPNHGGLSSDHAPWHRNGYPVCRTKEYPDQQSYHNENDLLECVNFDYLMSFAHIGMGWLLELAMY